MGYIDANDRAEINIAGHAMRKAHALSEQLADDRKRAAALAMLIRKDYIAFEILEEIVEELDNE